MYELKIRDYCFVAHSLKDEFFGPAKIFMVLPM